MVEELTLWVYSFGTWYTSRFVRHPCAGAMQLYSLRLRVQGWGF